MNATIFYGLSPLLLAIMSRNIPCVKLLLKYGADVNPTKLYSLSPLLWSIKSRNIPCVKLLLKYGADVNWVHIYDDSPLTCELEVPYAHDCVTELIQTGADVKVKRRRDGSIVLTCAMERRYLYDHVAELIQAGADVNLTQHSNGFTPLMLAAYHSSERLVRLLLRSGWQNQHPQ